MKIYAICEDHTNNILELARNSLTAYAIKRRLANSGVPDTQVKKMKCYSDVASWVEDQKKEKTPCRRKRPTRSKKYTP